MSSRWPPALCKHSSHLEQFQQSPVSVPHPVWQIIIHEHFLFEGHLFAKPFWLPSVLPNSLIFVSRLFPFCLCCTSPGDSFVCLPTDYLNIKNFWWYSFIMQVSSFHLSTSYSCNIQYFILQSSPCSLMLSVHRISQDKFCMVHLHSLPVSSYFDHIWQLKLSQITIVSFCHMTNLLYVLWSFWTIGDFSVAEAASKLWLDFFPAEYFELRSLQMKLLLSSITGIYTAASRIISLWFVYFQHLENMITVRKKTYYSIQRLIGLRVQHMFQSLLHQRRYTVSNKWWFSVFSDSGTSETAVDYVWGHIGIW